MFCHRIIELPAVDVDDMKMPLFEEEGGAQTLLDRVTSQEQVQQHPCQLVVMKTQILVFTLRYPLMDFRRDVNYYTVCQS